MTEPFPKPLCVTPNADGSKWRLDEPFQYAWRHYRYIDVPAGFRTDFASIPPLSLIGGLIAALASIVGWQWLFWIAMGVVLISHLLLHTGSYVRAAVIHDYLYSTQMFKRSECDLILFEAMGACGTHLWKRVVIWMAVRLAGWLHWHSKKRKIKK